MSFRTGHGHDGHGLPCRYCRGRGSHHGRQCMSCEGAGFVDWIKGAWNTVSSGVQDAANKVSNEFTNPNSVLRQGVGDAAGKVAHEFTDPDSVLRGKVLPEAASIVNKVTPFLQEIPIVGEIADAADAGLNIAQKANSAAKMVGLGFQDELASHPAAAGKMEPVTASTEGYIVGQGVKARRVRTRNGPVALRTRVAPRHTSERNAVVRKVMTEHKLSMIAASKYVKEHGLWKATSA